MTTNWRSSRAFAKLESHRALKPVLNKYSQGLVVDIGCGQFPYKEYSHHSNYYGFDLKVPADVVADALDLPLQPNCADTILSFQLLEHLTDPNKFINSIFSTLKPGGYLILTTPMTWPLHDEPHDYWRFTPHGLAHLAKSAGFEGIKTSSTNGSISTVWQMLAVMLERPSYHAGLARSIYGVVIKGMFRVVQPLIGWADQHKPVVGLSVSLLLIARKPK